MTAKEALEIVRYGGVGYTVEKMVEAMSFISDRITPTVEQEEALEHFNNLMSSLKMECGVSKFFDDDVEKIDYKFNPYNRTNYKESIAKLRVFITQSDHTLEIVKMVEEEKERSLIDLIHVEEVHKEKAISGTYAEIRHQENIIQKINTKIIVCDYFITKIKEMLK